MKYFTVGPSELYPIVPSKIKSAVSQGILSMSHRAPIFDDLFESTVDNLRSLLAIPKKHSIFFLSSGTEGMERIIQNMAMQNTLVFTNACKSGAASVIPNDEFLKRSSALNRMLISKCCKTPRCWITKAILNVR